MFSFCFNVFIYFLTILQSVTASASVLASNVLVLIQFYCLYCVYQIAHFADACNVINVHQCNYCCLLNKFYCLMNSMQDVEESLMSRSFSSTSMLPPTASCISIVTPTTRLQPKVIATAMLCFVMQYRWFSPVSFKFTKSLF